MQPCDELKNLIIQLYASNTSGGLFDFARQLYSRQEDASLIGSDPKEYYKDFPSIIHLYELTSAIVAEIDITEIDAYRENEVGWVVDRVNAKLPNGNQVPVRHSYIFHRENDAWKIVHAQITGGIPDESFGA